MCNCVCVSVFCLPSKVHTNGAPSDWSTSTLSLVAFSSHVGWEWEENSNMGPKSRISCNGEYIPTFQYTVVYPGTIGPCYLFFTCVQWNLSIKDSLEPQCCRMSLLQRVPQMRGHLIHYSSTSGQYCPYYRGLFNSEVARSTL